MQDSNKNDKHSEGKTAIGTLTPNRHAQVVVIGAGLAGLAAAHRLNEAGVQDVIILEAQNRIGGRIHTIDYSNYLLELGAQWLHGAEDNPLYKWLTDRNMLDDFEDASMGFQGMFCSNKRRVIDEKLVEKVLSIAVESKLSLSKNRYTNTGKNAADVFRHHLDLKIEQDKQLQQNKTQVYAIFDWFLRYETVDNSCDSMNEVSVTSYTDWTDWGDGTLLNFKHGYRSLVDWFCNQMPSRSWIHLNKSVANIEMLKLRENNFRSVDGSEFSAPIVVRYVDQQVQDGKSDSFGIIECDHVIFTGSLGFLKHNHQTLFTPALPDLKRELVESIGFGTVNKIFLEFKTPFWNDSLGIKLVWEDQDLGHLPAWTKDIVTFDVVRKQPNLLLGWVGGQGAKLMEKESDEKVAEICLEVLHHFLPETYNKPSELVSCICSRWYSNPYTRGSYSFQSMQSFGRNTDKLHEPLFNTSGEVGKLASVSSSRAPRVLFAGEATSGKLYSTAHGAIISGWREADRLVDYISGGKEGNLLPLSSRSNIALKSCS